MNVTLWNEIYKKHGKTPPSDSFWVLLKNITGIDPAQAKKIQNQILKWYGEDMSNINENVVNTSSSEQNKSLRSTYANQQQMQQQLIPPQISNSQDDELIQFGKVSLSLPKKDLKKQWDKLQKYMEIYLEDYVEEVTQVEEPTAENAENTDEINEE